MRVGTVRQAHPVQEGFWVVLVKDWQSDIKPGQLVEQVRGSQDTSVMLWEVVSEDGDRLVLLPQRGSTAAPQLLPEDGLDFVAGGLGLGDVVAKVTKAMGIEPCESCEERRKKLNKLFPEILKK